jgi:hypothetical protein
LINSCGKESGRDAKMTAKRSTSGTETVHPGYLINLELKKAEIRNGCNLRRSSRGVILSWSVIGVYLRGGFLCEFIAPSEEGGTRPQLARDSRPHPPTGWSSNWPVNPFINWL